VLCHSRFFGSTTNYIGIELSDGKNLTLKVSGKTDVLGKGTSPEEQRIAAILASSAVRR
jgi:hypothetical protein